MPYMSYFERKFRAEGEEIGLRKGRQEGLQEGLQNILKLQLEERFGPLPKDARDRLAAASDEQLLAWGRALLHASTLEEVFHLG